MNKLELLSPAGDITIFKSVVDAGADAVYFGGDLFGARAYAKNFSMEEAKEAIRYAHLHGAKAYLTVNTLLKNVEIERNLYNYLRDYVEMGIDAFIVQDMGVFAMIREFFPDTHIHVSTQVSVCTESGAAFFESKGAKRIVTAREIGINEISAIHKRCPNLEIESFVHGALCVCYSGQCLMSSILGGRSGNRGRCAQPCRLPYDAYDKNGNRLNDKGNYILSPKDFCTINSLPEMIEAGVVSFKVEGRMKQLEYATGVISVYRHYIDKYLYQGAKNYSVKDEDINKLLSYGNRSGFTDLYLHKHNGPEMMTFEAPSHTKSDSKIEGTAPKKLKVNCKVKALIGKPFSVEFYDENDNSGLFVGQIVESASKKPTTVSDISKAVGGLGNTEFVMADLKIDADDNIFLPVSVIKNARRNALEQLCNKLLLQYNKYTVKDFIPKSDITNSFVEHTGCFVTVSSLEQYKAVLKFDFVDKIAVPINVFKEAYDFSRDKKLYIYLPTVLRKDYRNSIIVDDRAAGVIACSMDEIGLLEDINYPKEKVILDHRIYSFNNRCIEQLKNWGYFNTCIPYELSIKELKHRNNSNSQMIVYSRIPMMVTANCTVKNTVGCKKQNSVIEIVDRKNEKHTIVCNCDYCYNTIYNSKKYMAFSMKNELDVLGIKDYRMDFTTESTNEIEHILGIYSDVFINGKIFNDSSDKTLGHLKRGVE